jgi:MerR family transcriptional regulator/heat shock protein HspR
VNPVFAEDQGVYTIGTVARLLKEHPETLRVWERHGLIRPDRRSYQRKYSNQDLKRLAFIKHLLDDKGLNLAGVKHIISMYPCWYKKNCSGGARKNSSVRVNESKACWKQEGTYCLVAGDKAEMCSSCHMLKNCKHCHECE